MPRKTLHSKERLLLVAVTVLLLLKPAFILPGTQRDEERQKEESADPYSDWLDEDVVYIVTPEERSVFERLTTDEEKENFIEQFWRRRDPHPSTDFNEFKVEHYRRIAYANERYSNAGVFGWQTDRGRIYITFGPPESVDKYGAGATYYREIEEGGGATQVYPMEKWFYNYIEGIGNGIEIEFVDRSMTGDFRIALRPEEKDALLRMPGGGKTLFEKMGFETRASRIRGSELMRSFGGDDDVYHKAGANPFLRLERYFQLQKPPEIKFTDLKAQVDTRVRYTQFPVSANNSHLRLNDSSFLAPITVYLPVSELTYQSLGEETERATVNLYGAVRSAAGRVIQEFEETVYDDRPAGLDPSDAYIYPYKRYQKIIPLSPGLYKLSLVVEDVTSGEMGYLEKKLNLPVKMSDELSLSSVVLSDLITPAKEGSLPDPFVTALGWKVYPVSNNHFRSGESLGMYFEVYNFAVDGASSYPDLDILAEVKDSHGKVLVNQADQALFEVLGDRIAVAFIFGLKGFGAGKHDLELKVEDRILQKKVLQRTRFQVLPDES